MRKTLTIRISNEIGNQMFMYASSFAIAKKLNRELYIDNESAFLSKKILVNMHLIIFQLHQIKQIKILNLLENGGT